MLSENLQKILDSIRETALKCGRNPEEIKLVAVLKTKPIELIR